DRGRPFCLRVDPFTYKALFEIYDRYRKQEKAAGRTPKPYQVSCLVREGVYTYESRHHCRRPPHRYNIMAGSLVVGLDARSRSILRRVADTDFDGNKSATMRAMIYWTAFPFIVGVLGGPKRW